MNEDLRRAASGFGGWTIAMGVAIVIVGMIAAATPILTFISATLLLAFLISAAGIFAFIHAFQDNGAGRKLLDILLGVISLGVAAAMLSDPAGATLTLAIWIAIWLIMRSVIELVWAFTLPFGRALHILNGVVDLVLGLLLLRLSPASALAALGFYIAISLIFWGIALIARGSLIRDLARAP